MWRPFDSPAKRRKRFIEKNSPYLVPLAVGALAAGADENATGRQRLKRGLVTGGQTFAAMKTAGVFANNKSKQNYFKSTILPGVKEVRGIANTGLNIKKDIRSGIQNALRGKRWHKSHKLDVARAGRAAERLTKIDLNKEMRAAAKFEVWKNKNGI